MPIDFTGLGAFGSQIVPGMDAEQDRLNRLRQQQQQIGETDQNKAALALLLSGLSQGQGGSSQGLNFNQPVPVPAPMAAPSVTGTPPMTPGYSQGISNAQNGPQAQPMPPQRAPGAPMPPQTPGASGGSTIIPTPQAPNFQQQLMVFANNIRRANPQADPAAVGQAVLQYAKLIQTDDSRETRLMAQMLQQQGAFDRAMAQIQGANQRNQNTVTGAGERAQAGNTSRERIAAARDAIAQAGGAAIPDEAKTFLAQELIAGNLQGVNEALGFSRNRAQILGQIIQTAQQLKPGFDGTQASAALAQFGGTKAAAGVVGRTAGSVAVGGAEIPPLSDLITSLGKINTTKFPTVNAVENAVRAGTGDANIVSLRNYIQTLRNAYSQIASRGGRITDQVRKYGEELISGNMPLTQLKAATEAMRKEAEIVKGATGAAMQEVTGGTPVAQPGAAPAGDGWTVERVQ